MENEVEAPNLAQPFTQVVVTETKFWYVPWLISAVLLAVVGALAGNALKLYQLNTQLDSQLEESIQTQELLAIRASPTVQPVVLDVPDASVEPVVVATPSPSQAILATTFPQKLIRFSDATGRFTIVYDGVELTRCGQDTNDAITVWRSSVGCSGSSSNSYLFQMQVVNAISPYQIAEPDTTQEVVLDDKPGVKKLFINEESGTARLQIEIALPDERFFVMTAMPTNSSDDILLDQTLDTLQFK